VTIGVAGCRQHVGWIGEHAGAEFVGPRGGAREDVVQLGDEQRRIRRQDE
jgi:hypothetical protein